MSKVVQLEMVELKYHPKQAVHPQPCPNRDIPSLSSLSSWPRDLESSRCMSASGFLRCPGAQATSRGWAFTQQTMLTSTLAKRVFPTRIPPTTLTISPRCAQKYFEK